MKKKIIWYLIIPAILLIIVLLLVMLNKETTSNENQAVIRSDEKEQFERYIKSQKQDLRLTEIESQKAIKKEQAERATEEAAKVDDLNARDEYINTKEFWEMPFDDRLNWIDETAGMISEQLPQYTKSISKINVMKAMLVAGRRYQTKEHDYFVQYVTYTYPEMLFTYSDTMAQELIEVKARKESFWEDSHAIKVEVEKVVEEYERTANELYVQPLSKENKMFFREKLFGNLLESGSDYSETKAYDEILKIINTGDDD